MDIRMVSLVTLVACAGGDGSEEKDPAAAPARDEGGRAGEGGSGNNVGSNESGGASDYGDDTGSGTLYVVNASTDITVCYVYADTCDGAYLSDDLLGDTGVLDPGYYLQVEGVPADCYDLYAFDC